MILNRLFISLLILAATLAGVRAEKPVNTTRENVAIKGYDPVAYFTESKPAKGSDAITWSWNGAVWRFASSDHRDAFKADPEKYAPQFGGYCAWAVSRGYTAAIDPEAWKIVNGRLYLNYSLKVQANWEKDAAGNIAKAEANWPAVLKK